MATKSLEKKDNELLVKNLAFIKGEVKMTWQDFYATININENTFNNYKSGDTSPSDKMMSDIALHINELISSHEVLKARFPKGVLAIELKTEDLEVRSKQQGLNAYTIFTDKFVGDYMCYYMSTNIEEKGKKATHSGILQLRHGDQPNEFLAYGVFSFKSVEDGLALFNEISDDKLLTEKYSDDNPSLFIGKAYLSSTLLWCNLSNSEKKEHVSISFDLSEKITTKHPDKIFYGVRGIALAQTSGHSNQTTTLPIVIAKTPLTVCPNKLEHYLRFNYTELAPQEIEKLAVKTINFFNSQHDNPVLKDDPNNELLSSLLVAFVKHELKDLINRHIFNSHYFQIDEMEDFYKEVIRPMRKRDTLSDKID